MIQDTSPKTINRLDYTAPEFWLDTTDLVFELSENATRVRSMLSFRRNTDVSESHVLRLDGENLKLISVKLDGQPLDDSNYQVDETGMTLTGLSDMFVLEIETECDPQNNTRLEGLYKSSGNYCTQCEAQGFRRITYFPDRPDVMSVFSVEIIADKDSCPIMLSNGNLIEQDDLEGGRHRVRWEDPFPKPSYLFALVAGDLACIEDGYKTSSGRMVALKIYVQEHNVDKCAFAMESLKKSMEWDEKRFGLEYDLDIYMIVAVDDFNMGAMENKGLNVFNSKYVLADLESATDADFEGVESVIGHEYFHNWTGNRVTCRDWFQLSLKEGLTVFRDQEFSADLNSRSVRRIDDVRTLRARQFPEDAGPMAHPIRPDAYIEINNFYTATVYEKGAEVIRMMHTLLGEARFRKGMDLYFERHDGQAVTCEDFVLSMESASGVDLTQFRNWYSQAGTPTLSVESRYDDVKEQFSLTISQSCKTQVDNKPYHIPFAIGLLDEHGAALALSVDGLNISEELVLDVTQESETFIFNGVKTKPVPSLLRGFSAPVNIEYESTDEELAFLMKNDSDSFNQWESSQKLSTRIIERGMESGLQTVLDGSFAEAIENLLEHNCDNAALRAEALKLASLDSIAEKQRVVDIDSIYNSRENIKRLVAETFKDKLVALYNLCAEAKPDAQDAATMETRRLKNVCLNYLTALDRDIWKPLALNQLESAVGMTDSLAALNELTNSNLPERETALKAFFSRWKDNKLVIDKWFAIQAVSTRETALQEVLALTEHNDFDISNPNRVRSLVSMFSSGNPLRFHALDGEGYKFLADYILLLDAKNPQLASRLVTPLSRWKRYAADRQALMKAQLAKIAAKDGLSPDVFEMVNKSLG